MARLVSNFTPVRAVVAILVAGGLLILLSGLWLPTKAALAQLLLHRAWDNSKLSSELVKPWPWADTWPIGRLVDQKRNIDLIVLEGESGESLAFGPGHLTGSAKPGEGGHCILPGHRDTSFAFLEKLQVGDELILEGRNGKKMYRVQEVQVVEAKGLFLNSEMDGVLTLITCYPFNGILPSTPFRFVVTAMLIDEQEGILGAMR